LDEGKQFKLFRFHRGDGNRLKRFHPFDCGLAKTLKFWTKIPGRKLFKSAIESADTAQMTQPVYILAPYVPTPTDVVDRMLRLAQVTSDDVVCDLGCGDGRIVIAAARDFGARGVGMDIEPYWIEQSCRNARDAGVVDLVTFRVQDALTADLSAASVVMLYLVDWSVAKLRPIIERTAKPGTRLVSNNFGQLMGTPAKEEKLVDADGTPRTLFLWVIGASIPA
jgi:SAM-dependent methyltransferase